MKPTNASYQYIVLPNKTSEEVSSYASDNPISILSNTSSVQAVRHNSLGIAELLFYQPGTVTVRDGLIVTVDQPVMVIVDESAAPVRISVANPETPGITVNVTLDRNGETSTTSYTLGKDTFTGRSMTLDEGPPSTTADSISLTVKARPLHPAKTIDMPRMPRIFTELRIGVQTMRIMNGFMLICKINIRSIKLG